MKNIIDSIDRFDMAQMCFYLQKNQWTQLRSLADGKINQYLSPNMDMSVLVPLSKEFSDYNYMVQMLLEQIAVVEGTSQRSLCTKLLNPSSDILHWHIDDLTTSKGEIPFGVMQSNIENIRNILATTCSNILSPSIYHSKINTQQVAKQMDLYRFGQTEVGSYILNLVCPLGNYQFKLFNPQVDELPLSRRINIKLLGDIANIQDSLTEGDSRADEMVSSGEVSVNFMNTLISLYDENKDSKVDISAAWNSDVPIAKDTIQQVRLNPYFLDAVGQIAEKYTPQKEQYILKTYYGKISQIIGDPKVENRDVITISVATIGEANQVQKVRVELNNHQYAQEVMAAFDSGSDVKVSGIQILQGATSKLQNATFEKL